MNQPEREFATTNRLHSERSVSNDSSDNDVKVFEPNKSILPTRKISLAQSKAKAPQNPLLKTNFVESDIKLKKPLVTRSAAKKPPQKRSTILTDILEEVKVQSFVMRNDTAENNVSHH